MEPGERWELEPHVKSLTKSCSVQSSQGTVDSHATPAITWNWGRLFWVRRFARLVLLIGALTTACLSTVRIAASQPNVVILLADDLGYRDLGCYGGPVKTPVLDRLAESGVRFSNFYSGAAVCSPSRAVLLTGRNNLRSGIYSWINDNDQTAHLPRSEVTIAEMLQLAGYSTAHFGKWHLGMPTKAHPDKPMPDQHGFDYWFATANNAQPSHHNPVNFIRNGKAVGKLDGYACDIVVDEAIEWLSQHRVEGQPFFLNLWFHEPHAPLAAPESLTAQYGDSDDPAAVYSATIANTDRAIGRLLARLQEVDRLENTLVIYASDNGSYRSDRVGDLRGVKGSNYEGGIRVPGIFSWPGHWQKGHVIDQPAGLVDLLPTIAQSTKTKLPDRQLDGTDLSSLLRGTKAPFIRQKPLFWILPLSGPAIAMRDQQHSLVAFRKGVLPKDYQGIDAIKQKIKALLTYKGILESETRGSSFEKQLFEGFNDREADQLRGKFIRLNQFQESWIPSLKQSEFHRFALYDLIDDPGQQQDLAVRLPVVHYKLKKRLQALAYDALDEAVDWSDSSGKPGPVRVHRLKSSYRSAFDAFLYVNRIPTETEQAETHAELCDRIMGRLANQEGRVLIKLPPLLDRQAYDGFKIALDGRKQKNSGRCFHCHQLPNLDQPKADPLVPTLRGPAITKQQLAEVLGNATHQDIQLNDSGLSDIASLLRALTDLPHQQFRQQILDAKVMNHTGDFE